MQSDGRKIRGGAESGPHWKVDGLLAPYTSACACRSDAAIKRTVDEKSQSRTRVSKRSVLDERRKLEVCSLLDRSERNTALWR